MTNHLELVKSLKNIASVTTTPKSQLNEMEIIGLQALLMQSGSATFRAINSGEIANILTGLVSMAYTAMEALSAMGKKKIEGNREATQAYQMPAIMRLLSEKIDQCASGDASSYCELYHLCEDFSSGFLNADFDKAFRCYHEWRKANPELTDICFKTETGCLINAPDLTDCLYE